MREFCVCLCFVMLCVHSSFAIILKRKWKLVALLLLSYRCIVTVVPWPLSNDPRFTQCIYRYSRASKRFVEVYFKCSVALPHGALGWSAVCDCGISWSYSLTTNLKELCTKCTVKPVLSSHSKVDKAKVLMAKGRLMKVESIVECSPLNILQYFWPALRDNRSWKPIFGLLFERLLKTGLTVLISLRLNIWNDVSYQSVEFRHMFDHVVYVFFRDRDQDTVLILWWEWILAILRYPWLKLKK